MAPFAVSTTNHSPPGLSDKAPSVFPCVPNHSSLSFLNSSFRLALLTVFPKTHHLIFLPFISSFCPSQPRHPRMWVYCYTYMHECTHTHTHTHTRFIPVLTRGKLKRSSNQRGVNIFWMTEPTNYLDFKRHPSVFPYTASSLFLFSRWVVSDSFATPWIVALQAPLSMGFPRQEYWSGLSFLLPRGLSNPGIEPTSPALAGRFFTTKSLGKLSSIL